jgi:hypothetical protein
VASGSQADICFEVLREIDLGDFGEVSFFPGDVNGDGKLELVFPQGEDGPRPAASTGFYPHEKTISCLTAIDLAGEVLWQQGRPRPPDHRKYHGSGPCLVQDVDADGHCEVLYATAAGEGRCVVRKLRGATGAPVAERETGATWGMMPANLRGLGKRDVVLGDALWLVWAYDEDLEPLLSHYRFYGGGHHHAAEDVDGNGVDDLFIGLGRYDAKGRRLWWRPDLDDILEQMPPCPHVDKVEVKRFFAGRDGWQVLWVGGHDVAMVDAADGGLLWRFAGRHLHNYAIGRFDPDSPDLMVYLAEAHQHEGSHLLRADGTAVWSRQLGSGLALTAHAAGPRGEDLLIITGVRPGERPYVIGLDGRKRAELAPLPPRPDLKGTGTRTDTGHQVRVRAVDIDADGRDELVAWNRAHMTLIDIACG